jgi:parvulin-like peptidyl-prolyl isomerase
LTKHFEEGELDKLMKKAGVSTPREFDQHLRTLGTSLEREKQAFIERTLAQQWVHQQIKPNEETTYDQMVKYYREHLGEFTTPARVKWEELMVRYAKYPTKAEARDAIARMGNQVFGGVPFEQLAKAGSDGVTAAKGGQWGWTNKGSLANQAVDNALFTLPVGRMSPIIEDARGYHIVRVTQREDEAVRPFLEAQVDIKKKIVEQRTKKQFSEYMADLEKRTPVWTVFDGKDGALHLANPQQPTRR